MSFFMGSNLLYSRITVEWAITQNKIIRNLNRGHLRFCVSDILAENKIKGMKRSQRDRQKLSKIYTRDLHFKSLGETFFIFVAVCISLFLDNDPMLKLYATHNSLNQLCYMTRDYIDKFIHFFSLRRATFLFSCICLSYWMTVSY